MNIEQRLARLEQANRVYRGLFIGAALVVVALVSWGQVQPIPEVIRARKFEVVNKAGVAVVKLESRFLGGRVEVNSVIGKTTTLIHPNAFGGGSLDVFAMDGKTKLLELGAQPGGYGSLRTFNRDGEKLVRLTRTNEGHGGLTTFSGKGNPLVELRSTAEGNGVLTTNSKDGEVLVALSSDKDGGGLAVFNKKKIITFMGPDSYGHGQIQVCDRSEHKCRYFQYAP